LLLFKKQQTLERLNEINMCGLPDAYLTTVTALLLVLVGKVIELAGYAKRFQVNTLRKRRVLSHFYLGKRAVMTRFQISKKEWHDGIRQLVQQLKQGAYP
jgi:hypothetical protein